MYKVVCDNGWERWVAGRGLDFDGATALITRLNVSDDDFIQIMMVEDNDA